MEVAKTLAIFMCTFIDIATAAAVSASCPPGYNATYGGSCYFFSRDKEAWMNGQSFCRRDGGFLAEVETQGEDQFLISQVTQYNAPFWFGGEDVHVEGQWRWWGSWSLMNYTNWAKDSGQPDNYQGNENCLHYFDFKNGKGFLWADYPCSFAENFICEVKQQDTQPPMVG